jgi:hypothetical protein
MERLVDVYASPRAGIDHVADGVIVSSEDVDDAKRTERTEIERLAP